MSDTLDNSYTRSPPPRSPFACHVYTTFLHTRNAFLKIVAKKRKEKKRKKRIASFFRVLTFSLCRFLLSIDFYDSLLLQATIVVCCASSMCTCPSRNTYTTTHPCVEGTGRREYEEAVFACELVASCIRQNREIFTCCYRCSIILFSKRIYRECEKKKKKYSCDKTISVRGEKEKK